MIRYLFEMLIFFFLSTLCCFITLSLLVTGVFSSWVGIIILILIFISSLLIDYRFIIKLKINWVKTLSIMKLLVVIPFLTYSFVLKYFIVSFLLELFGRGYLLCDLC